MPGRKSRTREAPEERAEPLTAASAAAGRVPLRTRAAAAFRARLRVMAPAARRSPVGVRAVAILVAAMLAAAFWARGDSSPTAAPQSSVVMTPTPWATIDAVSPTPSQSPARWTGFPIAVVVRYDDTRESISGQTLTAALAAGKLTVPCEVTALGVGATKLALSIYTPCLPAEQIAGMIHGTAGAIALLPPGLVTPSVKVLAVGDADLFGNSLERGLPYQLYATAMPAPWTAYDRDEVRTLISTGDTCPDRGVSHMAVVQKKGWDWVLDGGMARYKGTSTYGSWRVPIVSRSFDSGRVSALISDNDVSANDFECPMISNWVQHDTGTDFTIDPRVASLLATKGGVKVVTLGSNHMADEGQSGVLQTIAYLDAAGIKHTGAGNNLADALAPAVVDVRGLKFAFVGWDDGAVGAAATATGSGVAPLNDNTVCSSIKAARQVADIVIAMPQWGWPEYHATITETQIFQRALFYQCGADGVLGSGTHWASWASILPGPNGPQFAIGSHGNFLFDQSYSRQTMEGVIVEATFYGKRLVQFRLHPYVIVQGAQPNLTNPTTDGAYVLHQVWGVSDVRLVDGYGSAAPSGGTSAGP